MEKKKFITFSLSTTQYRTPRGESQFSIFSDTMPSKVMSNQTQDISQHQVKDSSAYLSFFIFLAHLFSLRILAN